MTEQAQEGEVFDVASKLELGGGRATITLEHAQAKLVVDFEPTTSGEQVVSALVGALDSAYEQLTEAAVESLEEQGLTFEDALNAPLEEAIVHD